MRARRALRGSGLVDGVTPAIAEPVAVQDCPRRQSEPRVTLFAADPPLPASAHRAQGGHGRLDDLARGHPYLDEDAATTRRACRRPGPPAGGQPRRRARRAVVAYDGPGTATRRR